MIAFEGVSQRHHFQVHSLPCCPIQSEQGRYATCAAGIGFLRGIEQRLELIMLGWPQKWRYIFNSALWIFTAKLDSGINGE
jgi:hypothetical protein